MKLSVQKFTRGGIDLRVRGAGVYPAGSEGRGEGWIDIVLPGEVCEIIDSSRRTFFISTPRGIVGIVDSTIFSLKELTAI
jgi:hypothetical protein